MFRGEYNGKVKHPADLDAVLERAWNSGVDKMIITVTSLSDAPKCFEIADKDDRLFTTMGCHPTRCKEFEKDPEGYFKQLCEYFETRKDKIVAIGEIGLDYDRLNFCDKETQKKYFEKQLELCDKYNLPLFLHCRNAFDDFIAILTRNRERVRKVSGVVHSFDGRIDDVRDLYNLGLFFGINGCSLKTEANHRVVKEIPEERIFLETDSPWCGMRATHFGFNLIQTQFPKVKKKEKWTEGYLVDGRNEPCEIVQVLEVVAAIFDWNPEKMAKLFYDTTFKMFFSKRMIK